jgi:hypothetical protein
MIFLVFFSTILIMFVVNQVIEYLHLKAAKAQAEKNERAKAESDLKQVNLLNCLVLSMSDLALLPIRSAQFSFRISHNLISTGLLAVFLPKMLVLCVKEKQFRNGNLRLLKLKQ